MYTTLMQKEAAETPAVITKQLTDNSDTVRLIAEQLKIKQPKMVMIIGRGSSDHAGVFAKYLIEVEVGIPVFAAAPSVSSVYQKQLVLEDALVIAISQSGKSPDIIAQASMAKAAGAYCIALVNDAQSPLAELAHDVLPLCAGAENSVAATKSYLGTLSSLIHLTAAWTDNAELLASLQKLPAQLQTVIDSPTQLKFADVNNIKNLVVLARGLGYAVAKELALKLKEVCSIHAEAFSSAEFLHGPVTLVEQSLTTIDLLVNDESKTSHQQQIDEVKSRGANMIHLNQVIEEVHPRLAPLLVLQRFYLDVAVIALEMGLNPDEPAGLKKVTRTI